MFRNQFRTALAVQWLRFHTSAAVGMGLIPGQETKILQVIELGPKKKKKKKSIYQVKLCFIHSRIKKKQVFLTWSPCFLYIFV